jgi:protein-tyrosine phosphatase
MIDFHSHLVPGIDDGAANLDEARVGLATLADQGVTTIVTTPHIRGSLTLRSRELEEYLDAMDAAYESLATLAALEFPQVRLNRGVEIMLDVPSPKLDDSRLRLAGSQFALFEFPFMNIPPNSTFAVHGVCDAGVIPVIAHPERYANMSTNIELIEEWRLSGAKIQVNSGSLIGAYGRRAEHLAWLILVHGWADYLSSDYHSRGRCSVAQCARALSERGGARQLELLTVTNPARLLDSEMPLAVDALEETQLSFWQKVFR